MKERKIPLFSVFVPPGVDEPLLKTLHSGFIGEGPRTAEFELGLKQFLNHPFAALVNSGTTALKLALKMAGVAGKEVITTALTCWATSSAILNSGASIRWADIDPASLNISIEDVINKISPNTAAVMVVHWGGNPVDVEELRLNLDAADRADIKIIQDCAHALGSTLNGKSLPNYGDYACYSFQAIKTINCGSDGGLVCLPNADIEKRARLLRWFGISREDKKKIAMRCEEPILENGDKYHLNDFCSTIGLEQMKHLDETLEICRRNAALYDRELALMVGKGIISLPPAATQDTKSAYWLYTIKVERREDFIQALAAKGIGASHVHIRNDIHPVVAQYAAPLPMLDLVENQYVAIPVGRWVSPEDAAYIVDTIKGGW